MPRAGTANFSICLLDDSDTLSVSQDSERFVFVSLSFTPAKRTVRCVAHGEGKNECLLSNESEGLGL